MPIYDLNVSNIVGYAVDRYSTLGRVKMSLVLKPVLKGNNNGYPEA